MAIDGRYVESFKANLIDGRALAELTLSDLKDLEVKELRNRKAVLVGDDAHKTSQMCSKVLTLGLLDFF